MAEIRKIDESETVKAAEVKEDPAQKFYAQNKQGTLKLLNPFSIGSEEYRELTWDFGKLSGWDYATAWDSDTSSRDMFHLNARKALALFAMAVNKCCALDWQDVLKFISGDDAIQATQITTVFFVSAGRLRDRLSTKGSST